MELSWIELIIQEPREVYCHERGEKCVDGKKLMDTSLITANNIKGKPISNRFGVVLVKSQLVGLEVEVDSITSYIGTNKHSYIKRPAIKKSQEHLTYIYSAR